MLLFSLLALTADAARVIQIRTLMMALGTATPAEMRLMVVEKAEAMEKASGIMLRSGDLALVVDNYRKIVASNVARLSANG
jgi:hypothetical protein